MPTSWACLKDQKDKKRPRDVVSNAIVVDKFATCETEETFDKDVKDQAAKALGQKGGKARAQKLNKKQRSEIARRAAKARWTK